MAKEHPILFSAAMVRAILEGRKTQTRRVMKPQPDVFDKAGLPDWACMRQPYHVGDWLWVKETYCHGDEWDDEKPFDVDPLCGGNNLWYFADGPRPTEGWGKKRSALFMPKWVTRLWLEVTTVRVQRLQDITITDIRAEGVVDVRDTQNTILRTYHECWITLWDSLNATRGYPWSSNPWVWVYEFKRMR
jgi:hypothetical protein